MCINTIILISNNYTNYSKLLVLIYLFIATQLILFSHDITDMFFSPFLAR